jgi:hypothetical protein
MALNTNLVEQLAAWCATSDELADVRSKARSDFFGYDEPSEIKYLPGAGEVNGRERRFIGWFGFSFRLPDGRHPAEMAATNVLDGTRQLSALKSIQDARYIMALTTMVIPGKGVYLELEDEEFEIDIRVLSRELSKGDALCAHVLPAGRGRWVVCPGWLVWPTRLGPNIRANLRKIQPDPVLLERFLQQRASAGDKKPRVDYPRDNTLEEAVARMTEAAQAADKPRLVRSVLAWKRSVLACMKSGDMTRFSEDVMKRLGDVPSLDDLNRWLALAMNIWNTTPQPDRGGSTAQELSREEIIPFD